MSGIIPERTTLRTDYKRRKAMIIVGELINASRKAIAAAIENQDAAGIQKVAANQQENGAHYIDVNAGVFVGKERDYLKLLMAPCSPVWTCPVASTVRTRTP
jgi:5-methyltetrahydrofolate--homocysteine methyltransferase